VRSTTKKVANYFYLLSEQSNLLHNNRNLKAASARSSAQKFIVFAVPKKQTSVLFWSAKKIT